jgi:hypothetical protein
MDGSPAELASRHGQSRNKAPIVREWMAVVDMAERPESLDILPGLIDEQPQTVSGVLPGYGGPAAPRASSGPQNDA